jgi:bifunctional non-homologous end joining protein LigD
MTTKKTTASKNKTSKRTTSADAVDNQLARYRSMRDFSLTTEPSGAPTPKSSVRKKSNTARGLPFVIQKHAASHLHYDLRLGWAGVLKSWAIAKGPSLNPQDRRLAVQVEDHPIAYGGFEGIIPKGQYGGGTVMIWDHGTWWPQLGSENVEACLHDGHLKFEMNGKKLKGKWALIRMGGHAAHEAHSNSKLNWLLIKEHDRYELGPDDKPIIDESPNSVVTNRSLDQIAAAKDHVWNSKETAGRGKAWFRQESPPTPPSQTKPKPDISPPASRTKPKPGAPGPDSRTRAGAATIPKSLATKLTTLPKEPQPTFIPPQLALEAASPPATGDWLHELKLDGYRIQARLSTLNSKTGAKIQLLTRKGLDWAHRMPTIAAAIAQLPVRDCTLDGEVVVLGPDGNSSFADLQASFQDNEAHPLTYFVFDLLHLNGHNPRDLTLRDRKQLLADLLPPNGTSNTPDNRGNTLGAPGPSHLGTRAMPAPTLRLSEHIEGNAETIFHHACALHAEGIISKRADAPYRSSRSSVWLKSKCLHEQEFVIAGYTLSTEGPDRIGSLLLGYYAHSSEQNVSPTNKPGAPGPSHLGTRVSRVPKEPPTLIYAGRTGTGFTQKLKRDLLTQLSKLKIPKPAFTQLPAEARRGGPHWVSPKLVAQVRFATWTADSLVRQAAFLGLREDKPPTEVTREEPTVAPQPKKQATHRTRPAQAAKTQPTTNPRSTLRLTHPEKILDPESGLTKQQLADYYAAVAAHMLPHIADRPLSLVRCPEGAGKPCFFQKHVTSMLPSGIGSIDITDKKSGKPEPYITLNTSEALISLAQLGVLEVHPWGSKNNDIEHPDRLIFDLDPDESLPWPTLTAAAAEVRKRLKKTGLESFLKLTGGKGLHIVAPIEPQLSWPEVKELAHTFVLSMERDNPTLYLTKMTKSARTGKIYLDYLRNERGATAVAPYSPRARLGAHVSLPLPWSALKEKSRPVFSVHDLNAWRSRLRNDPWKALLSTTQQLHPEHFDTL